MKRKQGIALTVAALAAVAALVVWFSAAQRAENLTGPSAPQHLLSASGEAASQGQAGVVAASQGTMAIASSRPAASRWGAKFSAANDYRAFITDALPAALAGDGRAALYINDALTRCALVMKTYRNSEDPEAQLTQEMAVQTNAPQWTKDLQATRTRRCFALAKEDPFVQLPPVDGGYNSKYWLAQAMADGDALAQGRAAAALLADIAVAKNLSDTDRAQKLKATDENLRSAVASGDADVLFGVGMLLADERYSADPVNGVAVALAACDLGHDCSARNPENSFSNCALSGACPADADLTYYLQKSMAPDEYSKAYALSQTIKDAVHHGDWDTVMGYLKVSLQL